jgi:hypothetical protein
MEVHRYKSIGDPYGSGEYVETIWLTPTESKRLTLGWGPDLGGDYCADPDFWIDKESFYDTYTDIPERIHNLLWALPEYEQSLDIDTPIAV